MVRFSEVLFFGDGKKLAGASCRHFFVQGSNVLGLSQGGKGSQKKHGPCNAL